MNHQEMNFGSFDIRVNKLVCQETGTYNVMYNRPYQVDTTNGAVQRAVSRVRGMEHGIEPQALSSVASELIKPTANVSRDRSAINIPNGWDRRRLRFVMEVQVTSRTGSITLYYLQGYSSHDGANAAGFIDPNMQFFINSYMRVARARLDTPAGPVFRDRVIETVQVLNNKVISDNSGTVWRMRPSDMFAGIQSSHLQLAGMGDVYDNRTFNTGPESAFLSSRTNNVPTNYLCNFMRSYQDATELASFGQGRENILNRAQSTALSRESSVEDNPFLRMLAHVKGLPQTTDFTLNELVQIDPLLPKKLVYNPLKQGEYRSLHQAGQGEFWHTSYRETEVAAALANCVPTMMIESFIGTFAFTATNMTIGIQPVILPVYALSLTGTDLTRECNAMLNRIQIEVLNDISFGNQEPYDIRMEVDIFGETKIDVRLNGERVLYAVPSFGDGTFAPTYAREHKHFNDAANDLAVLTNELSQALVPDRSSAPSVTAVNTAAF